MAKLIDLDNIMNVKIPGPRDLDLHITLDKDCRKMVFEQADVWGVPMGLYVNKLLAAVNEAVGKERKKGKK